MIFPTTLRTMFTELDGLAELGMFDDYIHVLTFSTHHHLNLDLQAQSRSTMCLNILSYIEKQSSWLHITLYHGSQML